jgi:hypothetical protein
MAKSTRWKYYQPNKKDLKDNYGDCAVRSICKAEGLEWLDAYDIMYKLSREVQCPLNCKYGFEAVLKGLGYSYTGISNKKGTKRPTVNKFALEHKDGTYVLVVANHYVTAVDGYFYDTWDSGDCSMYGYWEKARQE